MARKRMIDPEFWSDEEIGQWSFQARLFYIALWNFADDNGRFKAHTNLLKSQIFPYDPKIDIDKIKRELNHKVQWYETDGLSYGHLRNFNKHQRIDKPQTSKLPEPPPFDEHSKNVPRMVPPNIREVNIREEKRREENITHPPLVSIPTDEYVLLTDLYGVSVVAEYVARLNDYGGQFPDKFRKYKSHSATIRNWMRKDNVKKIIKPKEEKPREELRYDPRVLEMIKATAKEVGTK